MRLTEKQFMIRNIIANAILSDIAITEDFRLQAMRFLIIKENLSLESYVADYVASLLDEIFGNNPKYKDITETELNDCIEMAMVTVELIEV